jgi:4-amino-4-deoxy-L-arabinose transferase-like glycosyltransferase
MTLPVSARRLPKYMFITLVGVASLLALAQTNAQTENIAPHWLQFVLLYAGIIGLIVGLGRGQPLFENPHLPRQEMLILILVLILALGLRLWRLDSAVRAPVDEVLPMTEILALWDDPHLPMIRQFGFISSPTRLYASWQAGSVALFGHNLFALRVPSAIIGTLTVAAVYFLGRVLFDARTALIAALLLATYPPHVHFSHVGMLSMADPLFGTLALAFIALALKSGRLMAWVLGGVALGLTQYFYEGGRLLFPALVVAWVTFNLIAHRNRFREWWRGIFLAMIAFLAIAFPVYFTLARLSDPLSSRLTTMALGGDDWRALLTAPPDSPLFDWLLRHTIDPLLLFINRPDPTPYYGGDTALLLIFLVPAFLLGLVWSLRSAGGRLLLLWFVLTWVGNLLLVDSALAPRYLVVFPAVMLLVALGITRTADYLLPGKRFRLMLVYVVFCALAQTTYYFGPHLATYQQQLVPGMDIYDALYRAVDLPAGTRVYIIHPPPTATEEYAQTMLRFLSSDKTLYLIDDPRAVDFNQLPANTAFFVPALDQETVRLLGEQVDLSAPHYTSDPVPAEQAYVLYLAAPTD